MVFVKYVDGDALTFDSNTSTHENRCQSSDLIVSLGVF